MDNNGYGEASRKPIYRAEFHWITQLISAHRGVQTSTNNAIIYYVRVYNAAAGDGGNVED